MIPRFLLPPTAYSSVDWFDREQTSLGRRWALVAATEELTRPGDYVAATIGRAPLIVVKGDDDGLRAFHNLCRHRGVVLLTGRGALERTINCFYHQWRYGLDGSLRVVPQRKDQFPDMDLCDWGLLPASIEVWEGMVFAHPDPAAPPLAGSLPGVPEHVGRHRPGLLAQVAVRRLEARCNWKLLVESQTERDRDGHGARLMFPNLMFPNLMMAAAPETFATYAAIPVGPDQSVIELRMRALPGADAEAVTNAAVSSIQGDIRVCEAIQQGVTASAFGVGPPAVDHEAPVEAFHAQLLQAMAVGA